MDLTENDNHLRTIIHIDLDCFYAQVEMVKNPKLSNVPLGVQQKNIVVTCNYLARDFGVKKCMLITDALKLCPNLTLVKGEDLHVYRQFSSKVFTVIQKYSNLVEKLGLDENFVDVTEAVQARLANHLKDSDVNVEPVGNVYGTSNESCECGCVCRLNMGSVIAAEIRQCIRDEVGLTCCAGIAHNKLLAKLAGAQYKPNEQTVVYPNSAAQLLFSLSDIRLIPGIGQASYESLKQLNITTIDDLRNCPIEKLQKLVSREKAKSLINLSYGKDESPVKLTGKPQSIGIEDSCRTISVEIEAKDKFRLLLHRLMILVAEDGRIPRTVKVTLRKFDTHKKNSHREQRQCNISPSLFTIINTTIQLSESSEEKLMILIMNLFHKLVDISKPFHVTLLGLSFTKFQERQLGKNSITSFLMKNLSVQSVTSLQSNKSAESTSMECSPISNKSCDFNTDGSESEIEPSPKKTKLSTLIAKRRCFGSTVDSASPSKLRVAELRLNSREMDQSPSGHLDACPENVDSDVFQELPPDVQQELIEQWKMEKKITCPVLKKPKTNTLLTYLIKNK